MPTHEESDYLARAKHLIETFQFLDERMYSVLGPVASYLFRAQQTPNEYVARALIELAREYIRAVNPVYEPITRDIDLALLGWQRQRETA